MSQEIFTNKLQTICEETKDNTSADESVDDIIIKSWPIDVIQIIILFSDRNEQISSI